MINNGINGEGGALNGGVYAQWTISVVVGCNWVAVVQSAREGTLKEAAKRLYP